MIFIYIFAIILSLQFAFLLLCIFYASCERLHQIFYPNILQEYEEENDNIV
jgi:hypothetical protein